MLAASDRCLVVALSLQKYHKGNSSGQLGDTSGFTHRSLLAIVDSRGQVWRPQRLSRQAKAALQGIGAERGRDIYPRFRAIAGLADEEKPSREPQPLDAEQLQLLYEQLLGRP
ncbi:hypothetical protein ACQ86G_08455 [Roseateles chitinivorans]|uniref:hypothetical protein n=1 Tax=Roseateles chitinivorans TaxID=2917965 RepID=UPI003D66EB6C